MSKSLFPKEMWYNPPLFYPVMKLYRRELIQSKGISFPEGVSRCEDRLFNLQVITHANIICYINNKPIYHWRQRESSATRQIGKMYKDYVSFISIIKENYIQAMNMHKLRPYFNLMCMQLSYNIFSVCVQTDIKSCKILKQFRNDGICNKAFQNTPIHMIDSRKRRVGIGIIKYRIYYLAYLMLRLFFILLPRKKSSDLFP